MKRTNTLLVALLAFAATVTPASALASNPVDDDGEYFCDYSDQTPGLGGQSGSCSDWRCYDQGGTITISVTADDSDDHPADVSGIAKCADGHAHCDGEDPNPWECDDDGANSFGAPGTECSGSSDEVFDNGLYVACAAYANAADQCTSDPDSCDVDAWCPVEVDPWAKVCLDPGLECPVRQQFCTTKISACDVFSRQAANMPRPCQPADVDLGKVRDWFEIELHLGKSSVTMYTDGTSAFGVSCRDYACTSFAPALQVTGASIGLSLS